MSYTTKTLSGNISLVCQSCKITSQIFFKARKENDKFNIEELNPPNCSCGAGFFLDQSLLKELMEFY